MNTQKNNVWENKANQLQEEYIQNEKVFANASGFPFDIRRIFAIWPFILLFGLLGYAVGNIVLRYSNPVYLVSTSISLEENQEVSIGQVFTGVQKDAFSDRISYFKSPALAAQLVDSLGLQYYAEAQGRFRNKSFYKTIKWQILNQNNNESETSLINFSLVPKVSGFHFISDSIQGDALWGQPFLIHKNMIVVNKLQDFNSESPIYCYNINKMMAAFNLSNGIELQTTKESAIINIKYTDISSERAIDILNGLISLFNHVLEQDKAQGFSQAINFIEQRMKPLRDELDSIENSLAQFKSSQGLGGSISANSEIFLSNIQNYDRQLTQINILENTIKAVESFIQNPTLQDADLAFVGIDNPGLQSILSQYQQMRMQRDKLALTAQESNPTLKLVNKNLADLKSNMENQLQNYKSNLRIAKDTYNEKIGTANSYLRSAPIAEKELIDKTRFQNIKEALYTTLLQKREEAAIAKASVTVKTKMLYPPLKVNALIKPSRPKTLAAAILIGLIIPIIFAFLKEVLNKKIISKKQLQSITPIPVIAELEQTINVEKVPFAIDGNQRTMFGEQIRSMRTNINFYLNQEKPTNYIVITSSVSGEGKSFLTMNLAKSYSIQGKKVAILEFDLRRPKIAKALGHDSLKSGISTFLTGKTTIEEMRMKVIDTPTELLDLYPCGPIPPNPQELLSNNKMTDLKKYLDSNYDIVIIDTPPFGIVADAQILGLGTDLTIIVTRFQQTLKEQILEINEWKSRGVFNSIALVFNGVKNTGYFGYKYGYYYYKRKYGYNYYSTTTESNKKGKE